MDERVDRYDATPGPRTATLSRAPRRSRSGLLVAVLLLLAGLGVVVALHPWHGGRPARPAAAPQAVRDAAAVRADVPIVLSALGTVTPLATVTVQSQISGQLMSVGFTEGQEVQKGDFLAQIDPRPYQAALAQAQGTLARDQALLANARLDLTRYRTLNRQDSIARQQVDTQVSLVQQYEGTVQTDQAAVDTQKLNLTYCHITAPVDGRVGLRLVDPGNYVQTGAGTGLVVITQIQPISVIFTLPEDDIEQVTKRMATGASLPVTASNRADTAKIATGTLTTIDNQVDTTTGTVKLRATFANDDPALFPNQFVNIGLLVDTLHAAVTVPTPAIQHGAPGTFVYVVNPDDTVSVRTVRTGPSAGEITAVLSGLAVGDHVVIDGADRLRDGAQITVPAASAAGGAPAAAHHRHGNGGHRRQSPSP